MRSFLTIFSICLLCVHSSFFSRSYGSLQCAFAAETATKKAKKNATEDRGLAIIEKNRDSRKRVALVIGNSNYKSSPLKNPANDARTMAATLRRLGFDVEEKTNLDYINFNEAVENFGNRLRTGGVGLFYYAGHGMQVNGANYLIPVDAKINSEGEVRYKAVDAGLILSKMEQAKSDVNIVVLDACRDNPFARSFRSSSRGLASIDAPSGTIISYATAPGKTASDGEGSNGLFTEELVKAMRVPGLKIEEVFKQVRKTVREKSANNQIPWESSSLEGNFHFIPPTDMTGIQQSDYKPREITEPNRASSTTESDLISSKYGRGVDKFLFGMSTDEINRQLSLPFQNASFSSLPLAGEYQTAEVRYIWQNIRNFPDFPNHELFAKCNSGSSYLCFLFDKNGLFRISLRLMNDCPVRKEVVRQVAEIYGIEMKAESFRHQKGDVIFYGGNGNDLSQLEWVRRGSPKYAGQDW